MLIGNGRVLVEDPDGLLDRPNATARYTPTPDQNAENSIPSELRNAMEVARKNRGLLLAKPGVKGVRAGYLFEKGAITNEPAVVVAVANTFSGKRFDKGAILRSLALGKEIDGVPLDIEIADPYQQLAVAPSAELSRNVRQPRLLIDEIQRLCPELETGEIASKPTYQRPADASLDSVEEAMTVTCHVSPDAGWRILKPFLQATERKLHLGMYDFTAPHIYQEARAVLKNQNVEWQQVLDPKVSLPSDDEPDSTKANDLTEEAIVKGLKRMAGDRFDNAFAHVSGPGRTFSSAYHIKVAVQDDRTFWLSSGNWQSSNQPDIDFFEAGADRQLILKYNREWHIVIQNATLAKSFQRFLDQDFATACSAQKEEFSEASLPDLLYPVDEILEEERASVSLQVFAPQRFTFTNANPLKVQPILTPDNYLSVVLRFLKENPPKKKFYFQNQSLNPIQKPTPEFEELMNLLVEYSNLKQEDCDARFIFRNIGPIRKKLESLKAAGFNMDRIRTQACCHTKGIIIDSETVLLGSHNLTNQGVETNRDASLLITHAGIAQYYEAIFLHDWERMARPTIREEAVPILAGSLETASLTQTVDMARFPFSQYEDE